MHRRTKPTTLLISQELRRTPTEAEQRLWNVLRNHGLDNIHFRRQHAIGDYIVDFCAPRIKLIIEVDGDPHLAQREYDAERTKFLESKGYRVLRFWNHDVMNNLYTVLSLIHQVIGERNSR